MGCRTGSERRDSSILCSHRSNDLGDFSSPFICSSPGRPCVPGLDNIRNYSAALNFSVPHSKLFTVSIVHILVLVVQFLVVHHRFMNIRTYELEKRLRMHTALRLVVQDKFNQASLSLYINHILHLCLVAYFILPSIFLPRCILKEEDEA
jgi:hypothetical protein